MSDATLFFVADGSVGGRELPAAIDASSFRVERFEGIDDALAAAGEPSFELLVLPASQWPPAAPRLGEVWNGVALGDRPALLLYADDPADLKIALKQGSLEAVPAYDLVHPPIDAQLLDARLQRLLEAKRVVEAREDSANRELLLKLERDVQIGRDIQLGFLPEALPQPDGWEIAARFHPAREVAGDFYDAFYMVNRRRLGFLIADVCDKGVGAALFMALFRTLVRSNAQQNVSLGWMDGMGSVTDDREWLRGDPGQRRKSLPSIGTGSLLHAMSGTNEYITSTHMAQGYFATMFFGMLDPVTGSLVYINGGHNPPMIVRDGSDPEFLRPTGPAVGMLPGAKFEMGQTQLGAGDVLYAYTDGVIDARSSDGTFYGEAQLFDVVGRGTSSAHDLVADIDARLKTHIGEAPQYDDITMIAVRRTPKSEARGEG